MSATTYLPPAGTDDEPPRGRNRRRILVLVLVAVLVVAAALVWIVAFSSVLGAKNVDVRGTHVLTPAQVRAAADVPVGTPLVRLDEAGITRRVDRLPEVARAEVSTSFPSTVTIAITERTPVGYVRRAGRDVLVDRTGFRYRTVNKADPIARDLPRLVLPSGRATGTDAASAGVAQVAAALPASLRTKVRSIQALDPTAITLVLSGSRVVRWGSSARSADKARVLPVLLKHRNVSQIDVTDPDQPFTH